MNDSSGPRSSTGILYEFPLRDATRLFMRLEVLDQQLEHARDYTGPERNRLAAHAVLSALDLVFREDLRAHLLQQIYYLQRNYEILRAREDIRQDGLKAILTELEEFREQLARLKASDVRTLRFDPLLSALRQRDSVTDAAMAVDLPMYQWWLHAGDERRQDDIQRWTETFQPLMNANRRFLALLRERGEYRDCSASQGGFIASITLGHELWMVRIALPADIPCFPQVSGASDSSKIHVRFFKLPTGKEGSEPYAVDFPFLLAVC